ncbi:DinB family protein [Gordonia sp. TBRC 11910]|uniref:DinB family protein n=1 Tax=Gordonia asplenii TaxID=2725283 RepID=A0A848KU08_9ACTN|nr:DinB family protein [Gordonia asplenii]NMN99982.1 DinB family protein [Gordonia asplenii]
MYLPQRDDEATGIANYIDQQLAAIRAAAFGLTADQLRETPCRSALSIGGLIKHSLHGLRGTVQRLSGEDMTPEVSEAGIADYLAQFAVGPDESVDQLLTDFDAAQAEVRALILAADPDAEVVAPPAPWNGVFYSRPIRLRYYLNHLVEEFARHAGHADIIREQIDGMSVPALVMTLEGAPANQFFTPYVAASGTIGA